MLERLRRRCTAVLSRFRISENTFMAILAVAIGFASGLGNYAFRKLIDFFQWSVIGQGSAAFQISFEEWSLSRLLVALFPVAGGLLLIPFYIFFAKDLRFGFSRFLELVNLKGAKVPGRTIFTPRRCQCHHHRHRWLGRAGGSHRPDRRRHRQPGRPVL
jgi:CIC family chloride channel protein